MKPQKFIFWQTQKHHHLLNWCKMVSGIVFNWIQIKCKANFDQACFLVQICIWTFLQLLFLYFSGSVHSTDINYIQWGMYTLMVPIVSMNSGSFPSRVLLFFLCQILLIQFQHTVKANPVCICFWQWRRYLLFVRS